MKRPRLAVGHQGGLAPVFRRRRTRRGLDAATGDVVWSQPVEGEALGLAAADNALFVSTDKGKIYCFRHGVTQRLCKHAPSFSDPYAANDVYEEAARIAVEGAGRTRGYCVVMGVGDGELAYRIAKHSEFYVVGLDKDAERVAAAREKLAQAGVYGTRVVVYHEPNDPPRFVHRFANLVVSDSAIGEGTVPYAPEIRPSHGAAVHGHDHAGFAEEAWMSPATGAIRSSPIGRR